MSDRPAPPAIAPGALVAGRYRIERVLTTGGMGVVYEARHEALDQRVAVKVMLPEIVSDQEAIERFMREARAAARLRSDHVVRVVDVATHEGVPYMAMEFLEGCDLSKYAAERGALPPAEAVSLVLQALEAIVEAHASGIVHRDLKPSNLFIERRPEGGLRVKVLDFGISKVSTGARVEARLTSTHTMLGSPAYMSPEQVLSTKNADERSDVWALGVILWELLTGMGAFDGETLGEIFSKIREEPLAPVSRLVAAVPAPLSSVVACAVERNRERRLPSARAFRDALLPFAAPAPRHSYDSLVDPSMDETVADEPSARPGGVAVPVANTADTVAVKPAVAAPMGATDASASVGALPPAASAPMAASTAIGGSIRADTMSTWSGRPAPGPRRKLALAAGIGIAIAASVAVAVVATSSTESPPKVSTTGTASIVAPVTASTSATDGASATAASAPPSVTAPAASTAASASASARTAAPAGPTRHPPPVASPPPATTAVKPPAPPPPPPPASTKKNYGI